MQYFFVFFEKYIIFFYNCAVLNLKRDYFKLYFRENIKVRKDITPYGLKING